ncbi:MAG TPA: peptidylprolyl isomerase [Candidatus Jacksonbacteria bacterium]|nr:peptidylprolyl isomerase [Candidatus Jacksonbacteria bacterium]HCC50306.1 peptidylprolyl isomerase [Candidatus Jacksonbacteria bacterium]HCE49677.1 peptidylprolyl isomerase [Candidatus Jacksonbacteria bacterium]HCR15660.1 peptidylprolyl isomerase [Candidatus Jacksonbacteria bacterium]
MLLTACAKTLPESSSSTPQDNLATGERAVPAITPPSAEVLLPPTPEDVAALPKQVNVTLVTNQGNIEIQLLPEKSPLAVANFLKLANSRFYDGVKFHRVIPDFMIQTGDPNSKDRDPANDGRGGPGYQFPDEVTADDQLVRGTVAMANAGPNTNGSQFFIVTAESTPLLNGQYTIFGKVTSGQDVAEKISQVERNEQDRPAQDIVISQIVVK